MECTLTEIGRATEEIDFLEKGRIRVGDEKFMLS